MRIFVGTSCFDSDRFQHFTRFFLRLLTRALLVKPDNLGDLLPHRLDRIKRGHWILENHGDVVAADIHHLFLAQFEQISPII